MYEKSVETISEIKTRDIDSVLEQSNIRQFKSAEQSIINHERYTHLQAVRKATEELKI